MQLEWIQTHSADQIAAMMRPAYHAGVGKTAYSAALQSEKGIYDTNGLMPADGPHTVVTVQNAFNPDVKGKAINLGVTYTNSFVYTAWPTTSERSPARRRHHQRGEAGGVSTPWRCHTSGVAFLDQRASLGGRHGDDRKAKV
ncbi:MAG: hypothetical protein ACR2MN_18410 [Acidimicrobiales bacterium]